VSNNKAVREIEIHVLPMQNDKPSSLDGISAQ